MKVLVTGGAGFIGSHLVDALLGMGLNVVVIDNLLLGKEENIIHNMNNSSFKFYHEDLLNLVELKKIFSKEKFDVVFHFAANSDIQKAYQDPLIDFKLTFMTTLNVLLCMREFNVKKILFASTSAIYGESKKLLSEDFGPLFPVSHYGAAKLASEAFISSFAENYGIQAWIFRFPNVVGERATHGAIFDFIKKIKKNNKVLEVLGDGNQNKPYLYVKDLIDAILFAWKHSDEKINYFNIGVETRTKVSKIAEIVIKNMNIDTEIVYTGGDRGWIGDVPEFLYDLSKIKNLGWRAHYSSDEAVELAVNKILESSIEGL